MSQFSYAVTLDEACKINDGHAMLSYHTRLHGPKCTAVGADSLGHSSEPLLLFRHTAILRGVIQGRSFSEVRRELNNL